MNNDDFQLQDHLEQIIQNTFTTIDEVYRERIGLSPSQNNENNVSSGDGSRLIFPSYSDEETTRVSEQELRFIFVDQFIKYCNDEKNCFDYYYSIETPTTFKYRFFQNNKDVPRVGRNPDELKSEGISLQSASIDLSIYSKDKKTRVAIIEFKKDGCSAHEIAKDFLKLAVEPNTTNEMQRYFIMISTSKTHLKRNTANGDKETGLLQHLKDKLNCDCFELKKQKTEEPLNWCKISLIWHRLPTEENVDNNNFTATFDINNAKGERFICNQ